MDDTIDQAFDFLWVGVSAWNIAKLADQVLTVAATFPKLSPPHHLLQNQATRDTDGHKK